MIPISFGGRPRHGERENTATITAPMAQVTPVGVGQAADPRRKQVRGAVPRHLLGSFAYKTQSGTLFNVGQTVGQPTRTVADTTEPAHAPRATLARVPMRSFCPDTEEVTGSNPVSPTEKALVSRPFSTVAAHLALRSGDLSAKLCRPISSKTDGDVDHVRDN